MIVGNVVIRAGTRRDPVDHPRRHFMILYDILYEALYQTSGQSLATDAPCSEVIGQ